VCEIHHLEPSIRYVSAREKKTEFPTLVKEILTSLFLKIMKETISLSLEHVQTFNGFLIPPSLDIMICHTQTIKTYTIHIDLCSFPL